MQKHFCCVIFFKEKKKQSLYATFQNCFSMSVLQTINSHCVKIKSPYKYHTRVNHSPSSALHNPSNPWNRQNCYRETTRTHPLAPLHGHNLRGNRCGGPPPMDPKKRPGERGSRPMDPKNIKKLPSNFFYCIRKKLKYWILQGL